MCILLLNVQLYPDFIGGVEKRNHDLAAARAGRGHRVTLVGIGNGRSQNVPGVDVLSMGPLASLYGANGRRKTLQVFWFAWLVLRLDLTPYDLVETSNIPYLHRILFAGRLIREKRIDLLLHAFASLPEERGARLVVFGDGPEKEILAALAEGLAIADRVELRAHHEDAAEIWRSIATAWIAVQPYSREGFGIFPLEPMALDVPVVYCDSLDSAVPELVRDGVEGLRSPATPEGSCGTLDRLLRDGELAARLGRAGAARALSYDVDRVGQ